MSSLLQHDRSNGFMNDHKQQVAFKTSTREGAEIREWEEERQSGKGVGVRSTGRSLDNATQNICNTVTE